MFSSSYMKSNRFFPSLSLVLDYDAIWKQIMTDPSVKRDTFALCTDNFFAS